MRITVTDLSANQKRKLRNFKRQKRFKDLMFSLSETSYEESISTNVISTNVRFYTIGCAYEDVHICSLNGL
jgi:hypothetical protein